MEFNVTRYVEDEILEELDVDTSTPFTGPRIHLPHGTIFYTCITRVLIFIFIILTISLICKLHQENKRTQRSTKLDRKMFPLENVF